MAKMKIKKEATVAVIIGLIIALVVTGGVLRARTALNTLALPTKESLKNTFGSKSDSSEKSGLFLELTTPDNTVSSEPEMTLSGKTLPGTYIAILGEKAEYLIVPSDLGIFSQNIALVQGANSIKINVYQADGTSVEKTLSAVYTTAEL